jgi:transaldolase
MSDNPLTRLAGLGQSVWYDYIRRDLYQGGELERLIAEDGLKGMTSNPSIFEKAIAASELYDDDVRREAAAGKSPVDIFEALAVEDVRHAADVFRPVYEASGGTDGFVSIEVGPHLALDTQGSLLEARRLWKACDRPNVMVKIPGTEPGVPAIRQCLTEGININVTLLFSVPRHRQVMEAYLQAMEARVAAGQPVDRIRSVASFFVSRVDTNVDKKLDAIAKAGDRSDDDRAKAKSIRGKVGIANARLAYQAFREIFGGERNQGGERFAKLKAKGVAVQRPLWASTSTKDPSLPDLYYVEALIGPDTVDTIPPETFAAYKDHGDPKVRIEDDLDGARAAFAGLAELGVDESTVYQELEDEGIKKFADSFDQLLKAVEGKEAAIRVS